MSASRIAVFALLVLVCTSGRAQVPTETLYPGLSGTALINALRSGEPTPQTRGYGPARDSMYTYDQRTYGRIRGVYTGYEITISLGGGRDASSDAFSQDINAEHTYPQSRGAGSEPQRSDMHNLFPTLVRANSSRGSLPFGDIADTQTDDWYRNTNSQSGIPTTAIDEWSERLVNSRWEPREDHKGNVARAMLYFATRWTAADQGYLTSQVDDLIAWNDADPVDAAEFARMEYNERVQGNRNPFIVDPSLARRAYRPNTVADEPTPGDLPQIAVWPNPARTSATLRLPASSERLDVSVADALGRTVWRASAVGETLALPVRQWAPGVYAVRVTGPSGVSVQRLTVAR